MATRTAVVKMAQVCHDVMSFPEDKERIGSNLGK